MASNNETPAESAYEGGGADIADVPVMDPGYLFASGHPAEHTRSEPNQPTRRD